MFLNFVVVFRRYLFLFFFCFWEGGCHACGKKPIQILTLQLAPSPWQTKDKQTGNEKNKMR